MVQPGHLMGEKAAPRMGRRWVVARGHTPHNSGAQGASVARSHRRPTNAAKTALTARGRTDPEKAAPWPALRVLVAVWSGKGVKGSTGSRMRSAGRSPSTERVRIEAKRTLDALGTTPRFPSGGQEKQAKRRAACTLDDRGRLAPLPSGKGRGGWERVANLVRLFIAHALASSLGPVCPLWGPRFGVRP